MKPYSEIDGIEDTIDELRRSGVVVFNSDGTFAEQVLDAISNRTCFGLNSVVTHYHGRWFFIYDKRRFDSPQDEKLLHHIHVIDAVFSD